MRRHLKNGLLSTAIIIKFGFDQAGSHREEINEGRGMGLSSPEENEPRPGENREGQLLVMVKDRGFLFK